MNAKDPRSQRPSLDPEASPTKEHEDNSLAPDRPARKRWKQWLGKGKAVVVFACVLLAFALGLWMAPGSQSERTASTAEAEKKTLWTCSMHPQIKLPEPGQCPICGMDLIPLSHEQKLAPNQVSLSKGAMEMAKLRTTRVTRGEAVDELRLLGRLEYDETAVRTITSWVAGRLDRLYVSTLGGRVGAGQPLAQVYSPQVYAAHQDLILARKQVAEMQEALPIARKAAESALVSARRRLQLLGLREEELARMEKADAPNEHVTIRSPFGGTVLEQMVNQGAYVATGTPLFRVTQLGRIWVQLDAYETDLSRIRRGDVVSIRVASLPGEDFEGKVTFIDPLLDPETRTARVRIEVDNRRGRLSPGMFAEAVVEVPETERAEAPLVIPESAVLFTGQRSVVFVQVPDAEQPTYAAREVRVGPRAGELYPVVEGLEEGERIVTRGAFALDAELQIRGGASMMTMADDLARARLAPFDLPADALESFRPLLEAALELHVALSKDDLNATQQAFRELKQQAGLVRLRRPRAAVERWQHLQKSLSGASDRGSHAVNLGAARQHFEKVSLDLIEVVRRFGNPLQAPVHLAYCPMAFGGKGAEWLQAAQAVQNPYFGAQMYGCGDILGAAKAGSHLSVKADKEEPSTPGHQH